MPRSAQPKGRLGERIVGTRQKLGLNQAQFAETLGVGQGNLSKWESGKNRPSPDQLVKIAKHAPDADKFYFMEEAGIPQELFLGTLNEMVPTPIVQAATAVADAIVRGPNGKGILVQAKNFESIMVPVLADAVAAGNPLTINEQDVESILPFALNDVPKDALLYGLRIEGDSMSPIMHDGDTVLINVNSKDPAKLHLHMVAVRVGDGVTIKYLRKTNKTYQLVPQNTSPRHEIRVVGDTDDWAVVGEVVKILADPPKPPKQRK